MTSSQLAILYCFVFISALDEDECDMPGVCGNGLCVNTEGSYTCNCPKGYAPGRFSPRCSGKDWVPGYVKHFINE